MVTLVTLTGCTEKFKKQSKSALEYKIIGGNGDKQIKYGDAVKFTAVGYYRDSLIPTPYDTIAQFLDVDSLKLPPDYLQVFKMAKKGDSIITRILVDSAMKLGQLPPFAKKGNYLGFRIKILDVTSDPVLAAAQKEAATKRLGVIDSLVKLKQKSKDDSILAAMISQQKINTVKSPKGVYVEIQNPGQGALIDSGKQVTVNYKGMTLNGKIFDQSYDANGKPLKPFSFAVGQHAVIEGWDDAIKLFKKGGKGRLFIPSTLGYGSRGAGAGIKPNENLIFEISIEDVMTSEQYQKMMAAKQKAMPQGQGQQQLPQGQGQQQPH